MLCPLLALLLGTSLGARAQTIHQWPATKVQPVGSPLSLECTVKGISGPNLFWYRQTTGGALQLLFHSITAGQVDSEGPPDLSASRPLDGKFILNSKKLLISDSGFYLCAWSLTMNQLGQTSVQKPHLLLSPSHPLQEPLLRDGWRMFVTGFLLLAKMTSRNQAKEGADRQMVIKEIQETEDKEEN